MTNRAIELAKSMGLIDDNRRSAYEEWVDLSEEQLQAFYEAAKRDGMIEMRERAAKCCINIQRNPTDADEEDEAHNLALLYTFNAIRALEVKP